MNMNSLLLLKVQHTAVLPPIIGSLLQVLPILLRLLHTPLKVPCAPK